MEVYSKILILVASSTLGQLEAKFGEDLCKVTSADKRQCKEVKLTLCKVQSGQEF